MKIDQIINEMTSSGAVASVSMPLGATQKRAKESVDVKGLKPVSKLKNAKKKGPYANSIVENKEQVKVSEAELQEDDLIIIPGRGTKRKNGFVPKGQSRVDHEVEMARSDVLATMKNAKSIYHMLKNRSEEEGIEGWVQEKLIKANDYLNAVKEYYDEQMMQEMNGGVIAAGGVGEGVAEGSESKISKCASLAAKYFNSAGLQHQYDIDEYIKNNAGNDPIVNKCASLAAKYFNSEGLQRQYDIDEYIKANAKQGVAEGSSDKVHLKTPKHGLADHPGRNTGVGLRTFAATPEQNRCPKCNSLFKNHYQEQGVAEGEDVDDTPATERVFKYNKNDPERLIARMEKEIQQVESEGWTIVSKRESPKTGNIVVKMIKKQGVAEGSFSPQEYGKQLQTKINQDAINKALVLKKQKQNLGNKIIANTIQQQLAKKGVAASKDKSDKKS